MVPDHQVKCLFRDYRQTGDIKLSASNSGMNRKTASKYLSENKLPSSFAQVRDWRTRQDPLEKVWIEAEEFLKGAPGLQAKSLFEHLRTFQRRVKSWRLMEGKDKEVSGHEEAIRCRSGSILAIKKALRQFLYAINATPDTLQVDNSSAATH